MTTTSIEFLITSYTTKLLQFCLQSTKPKLYIHLLSNLFCKHQTEGIEKYRWEIYQYEKDIETNFRFAWSENIRVYKQKSKESNLKIEDRFTLVIDWTVLIRELKGLIKIDANFVLIRQNHRKRRRKENKVVNFF